MLKFICQLLSVSIRQFPFPTLRKGSLQGSRIPPALPEFFPSRPKTGSSRVKLVKSQPKMAPRRFVPVRRSQILFGRSLALAKVQGRVRIHLSISDSFDSSISFPHSSNRVLYRGRAFRRPSLIFSSCGPRQGQVSSSWSSRSQRSQKP